MNTSGLSEALARWRHPDKRTWIILNPASIGETTLVCAFAQAFVATHGHGITMVVQPHHEIITRMYPGCFERVVVADLADIQAAMRHIPSDRFEVDMPFAGFNYNLGDGRGDALHRLFANPGRGGLSLTDCYRHVLRLPWDARLQRPAIAPEWMDEAQHYARSVGMTRGDSVILFPATSTGIAQLPDVFWSALAAGLKKNGYKVFCNMQGGRVQPRTMPIAGTVPVEIGMRLALPLVTLAGRMISPPHGMQCLQLLGGRLDLMSIVFAMERGAEEFVVNERRYSRHFGIQQFMFPELCVDMPLCEFQAAHNDDDEPLFRLATSIASQAPDNPDRFRRTTTGGVDYFTKNAAWLRRLTGPLPGVASALAPQGA